MPTCKKQLFEALPSVQLFALPSVPCAQVRYFLPQNLWPVSPCWNLEKFRHFYNNKYSDTPLKAYILHLKIDLWKRRFLLETTIFRCNLLVSGMIKQMSRWWQLKYFLLSSRSLGFHDPIWRAQPPTRCKIWISCITRGSHAQAHWKGCEAVAQILTAKGQQITDAKVDPTTKKHPRKDQDMLLNN